MIERNNESIKNNSKVVLRFMKILLCAFCINLSIFLIYELINQIKYLDPWGLGFTFVILPMISFIVISIVIVILLINKLLKKYSKLKLLISILISCALIFGIGFTVTSLSKSNIRKEANQIFGSIYCEGHHETITEELLTTWTCKLCGDFGVVPETYTYTPVICNSCARCTERCQQCGKIEK